MRRDCSVLTKSVPKSFATGDAKGAWQFISLLETQFDENKVARVSKYSCRNIGLLGKFVTAFSRVKMCTKIRNRAKRSVSDYRLTLNDVVKEKKSGAPRGMEITASVQIS